jgi:hypothetical protein
MSLVVRNKQSALRRMFCPRSVSYAGTKHNNVRGTRKGYAVL